MKRRSHIALMALTVLGLSSVLVIADEIDEIYRSRTPEQWRTALTASDQAETRRRAAYVLGRLPNQGAVTVAALAKAMKDKDLVVRWYSADSLGRMGSGGKPAAEALRESFEADDADAELRRNVAKAFGRVGDRADATLAILRSASQKSDEPLVATAAAESLARLTDLREGYDRLIALCDHEDRIVAFAALQGVERLLDARVPPAELAKHLASPDGDVRRAAARVVGKQGWRSTPLILAQHTQGADLMACLSAFRHVVEQPADDQTDQAKAIADFAWAQVGGTRRDAAAFAVDLLAQLGPRSVESLLNAWPQMKQPARARILESFQNWLKKSGPGRKSAPADWSSGAARWKSQLMSTIADKEPETRKLSLWLLSELPFVFGDDDFQAIQVALRDADVFNRRNAARILRQRKQDENKPTPE